MKQDQPEPMGPHRQVGGQGGCRCTPTTVVHPYSRCTWSDRHRPSSPGREPGLGRPSGITDVRPREMQGSTGVRVTVCAPSAPASWRESSWRCSPSCRNASELPTAPCRCHTALTSQGSRLGDRTVGFSGRDPPHLHLPREQGEAHIWGALYSKDFGGPGV